MCAATNTSSLTRCGQKARALDCDAIATGHYARVVRDEQGGRYGLARARDLRKDQSYVLYTLNGATSRVR